MRSGDDLIDERIEVLSGWGRTAPTAARVSAPRDADEVVRLAGTDTTVPGTRAYNPAFDVTPAELITAIVTEERVWRPGDETSA